MRISHCDVIVTSPGRNFVTLKIETEDGAYGLGDATLNGRELAVATYLEEHIVPLLIGRNATRIEDTWQYLYKGSYWRRGPVTMTSIGAVDVALWDLKGKALGVPVYELIGGRSRDGVTVYGHANGATIDKTIDAAAKYLHDGYRAVRLQSAIPGLDDVYGVGRGELYYEPTQVDKPSEEIWSTARYLEFVPELFDRARDELGPDVHLLHDAHHRLTPTEAAWLGQRLEDYRLFFLEDASPAELQERFRRIRQQTTIPLAVGEVFNSIYDCIQLITEGLIDFLRMTPSHSGGLTSLLKILHLAEGYGVRSACHGAVDQSPVNLAACIHLGTAIANFGIQEFMRHGEETNAVFKHSHIFSDGMLHASDAPGLGVTIDEDLAAEYPYQRAYLPIARLEDGSVHDW